MIYGLVAPGYEMAEVVGANLHGRKRVFNGADMSTKLKLMGVEVASFGDSFAPPQQRRAAHVRRSLQGRVQEAGLERTARACSAASRLATPRVRHAARLFKAAPLPWPPASCCWVEAGHGRRRRTCPTMPRSARATASARAQIRDAIREKGLSTVAEVKACTRAGTGCGGCLPQVTDLFKAELNAAGKKVNNHLCEHFPHSRQDLFEIVKIKRIKTFDALLAGHGTGQGCEVCKPAVASIFASLWNENILAPARHAPGLERPVPRQHPARRIVLRRPSGPAARSRPKS